MGVIGFTAAKIGHGCARTWHCRVDAICQVVAICRVVAIYRVVAICRAAAMRQPYTVALARHRAFPIPPALVGFRVTLTPCPCEAEVPFGRSMLCFFVKVVGVGNVCRFRFMRVAKRNGGALVGAVLGVRGAREIDARRPTACDKTSVPLRCYRARQTQRPAR